MSPIDPDDDRIPDNERVISEETPGATEAAAAATPPRRGARVPRSVIASACIAGALLVALVVYLLPIGADRRGFADAVPAMEETTRVYDRAGALIYEFYDKKRTSIPLAALKAGRRWAKRPDCSVEVVEASVMNFSWAAPGAAQARRARKPRASRLERRRMISPSWFTRRARRGGRPPLRAYGAGRRSARHRRSR